VVVVDSFVYINVGLATTKVQRVSERYPAQFQRLVDILADVDHSILADYLLTACGDDTLAISNYMSDHPRMDASEESAASCSPEGGHGKGGISSSQYKKNKTRRDSGIEMGERGTNGRDKLSKMGFLKFGSRK
jgi:hypothetical protein